MSGETVHRRGYGWRRETKVLDTKATVALFATVQEDVSFCVFVLNELLTAVQNNGHGDCGHG